MVLPGGIHNEAAPLLIAQWLGVETAAKLPASQAGYNLLLARLRSLRRTVLGATKTDLPRPQRLIFLKMVDRLRHDTLQQKLALRRHPLPQDPAPPAGAGS